MFEGTKSAPPLPGEADNIHFVDVIRDNCKRCAHCQDVCPVQPPLVPRGAITTVLPGNKYQFHHIPDPSLCIYCGQCLIECNRSQGRAIYECVDFVETVKAKIADEGIITVAMIAPSIRYTLGEEYGTEADSSGKMFAAMKALGFDYVYDVEFAADLTIIEEGQELLQRISGGSSYPLPQFTSCCPGWIRYAETFYPDLVPHISTACSPAQMLGSLVKTVGADQIGANPANIYTVQVMPCIAKKYEALRSEMDRAGKFYDPPENYRDIDATINTRELIKWINEAEIDFPNLTDSSADSLFGTSTGAATIFAASGGVMEAALRYVVEELNGTTLEEVEFADVRGEDALKEATVTAGGHEIKVAVINGLKGAENVLNQVLAGESPYHFIEVMTCPDGCINGGGQIYTDWALYSEALPAAKSLRAHIAELAANLKKA